MTTWNPHANELFLKVLEMHSPDERREYLDRACAGDALLRAEVASLMEASAKVNGFLECPVPPISLGTTTADLPESQEKAGALIGPYKLLEEIGEGGFGVVFMAEQTYPIRRRVALKVLKPGMDSRQVVARFEAERQALALMDHPNIARVFDGGETGSGRPYFVMELVRGIPLTNFCDQNHLSVRDRLKLLLKVCWAVQHAHQKGVIHRDLKPTNILVTLHDGVPVPKVIDFGIAKAVGQPLTDKTLFTCFAQMVGTPLYMSPEQAELSGLDVDTRSDVYSLGVLLYELLTGTTPFDKDRLKAVGLDEVRRIIREEEPARPSTRLSTLGAAAATASANRGSDARHLSRLIRGELDWMVMKALEKDRNRRYESVSALAGDIQRFLADEPVLACPPSVGYRLGKYLRRNREAVIVASVVSLALFGGLFGAAYGSIESARKREVAALYDEAVLARNGEEKAKRAAEDASERLAGEEYGRTMQVAYQECLDNNVPAALALLNRTRPGFRGWEWWYVKQLSRLATLTIEPVAPNGSVGTITSTAFSPDGSRVLIAFAGEYAAVMDAHTATPHLYMKHPNIKSARFNRQGTRIATGGYDGTARVWDVATGDELLHLKWRIGAVLSVSFSPDGERLLAAGDDNCARVWDIKTAKELVTCAGHTSQVNGAAFSPDGGRIVTASGDNTAIVWDAKKGTPLHTLKGHTDSVISAAFSPNGERVVTGSYDRTARIWDVKTGKHLLTLKGHTDDVHDASFSPDGSRIVTASWDQSVRVWDAKSGDRLLTLNGYTDGVTSASFNPEGNRILSGGHGLQAKLWYVGPPRGGLTFRGHTLGVAAAAIRPDGLRVVSFGLDKPARPGGSSLERMQVWDARTGVVTATYKGGGTDFQSVAFSPDGVHIVTGCHDGSVRVWNSHSGEDVLTLQGHTELVMAVAYSSDGKRIATGSFDGTIRLWDAKTGAKFWVLTGHTAGSVAFSPDGTQLATAEGSAARLLDANSGTELATFSPPLGVLSAAFSPDGKRVVTAGTDGTARVWDPRTQVELLALKGHTGRVTSASFSRDGSRILTASWDRAIRLWDAKSGTEVLALKGHPDRTEWAAFSPDGARIVSVSSSAVRVWDLSQPPGETKVDGKLRAGD